MTDLSDLTTDELLAKVSGQYLALHGVAMDLHDELRRRLSAGEQAEARVVELERERNEALARVDGGLWEDWLRASELRDVAERERDRLRAALDVIAGFEDVGPRQANEMREIARRVLSAATEGSDK